MIDRTSNRKGEKKEKGKERKKYLYSTYRAISFLRIEQILVFNQDREKILILKV